MKPWKNVEYVLRSAHVHNFKELLGCFSVPALEIELAVKPDFLFILKRIVLLKHTRTLNCCRVREYCWPNGHTECESIGCDFLPPPSAATTTFFVNTLLLYEYTQLCSWTLINYTMLSCK